MEFTFKDYMPIYGWKVHKVERNNSAPPKLSAWSCTDLKLPVAVSGFGTDKSKVRLGNKVLIKLLWSYDLKQSHRKSSFRSKSQIF